MQHSSHAKHKMLIAALLLALFAVPFVAQRSSLAGTNNPSILAGGAVVNGAVPDAISAPTSNNTSQAVTTSGTSFTGILVK